VRTVSMGFGALEVNVSANGRARLCTLRYFACMAVLDYKTYFRNC
jgi:hypothetical protein